MELAVWQQLLGPELEHLRQRAATTDPYDASALSRLRRDFDADLVHAALQLAQARAQARSKFGDRADSLVADPQGVEMASSLVAARHKAARFAAAYGAGLVLDLCCGIGGDSIGLAQSGLAVTAIDLDPVRAWMAGLNARCKSACADAADLALPDGPFHIDPARRTDNNSRRQMGWEDLRPGPVALQCVIARRTHGAIKLGPGIDFDSLPPGEVELLSEGGRLTQAVLWTGELSRGDTLRTATMLASGESLSAVPGRAPPIAPLSRYIFEPDDSIERAGLLVTLCETVGASMPHPSVGLLTSDRPIFSPWLTAFEVLDELPWNERRVAQRLAALHAGIVEVKTRGRIVDPDALQVRLSKPDGPILTLFVLRFDRALRAIIARRLPVRPQIA